MFVYISRVSHGDLRSGKGVQSTGCFVQLLRVNHPIDCCTDSDAILFTGPYPIPMTSFVASLFARLIVVKYNDREHNWNLISESHGRVHPFSPRHVSSIPQLDQDPF